MKNHTALFAVAASLLGAPLPALAAEDPALAQLRAELAQLKNNYETRIQSLEKRLQAAENTNAASASPSVTAVQATSPATNPSPPPTTANGFNPEISLVLSGTYANLSQNPDNYRIQGFLPSGDEIGPGKRSFNLGESELSFSANINPYFSGKLTVALTADNEAEVEEAFFMTRGLANGVNIKGGRYLSSIGYLNEQHGHTWDFVDAPLVYQAMLGGQYRMDGAQLKWLAPTDLFVELGVEVGDGGGFPGTSQNNNGIGSAAAYAHLGGDIGASASWKGGVSYLKTKANNREYDDTDAAGTDVTNAFDGKSSTWIVDGVYKWAPGGNATDKSFKLQGEYFWRTESGTLTYDIESASLGSTALPYSGKQSGGYVQGVYKFLPKWRAGLRYDRLSSGSQKIDYGSSAVTSSDFQRLDSYNPTRTTFMVDYTLDEFSRFRLQLAQDKSRPDATDNQVFLQYIMSLGAHAAHSF